MDCHRTSATVISEDDADIDMDRVWYASYGSNMNWDRFMCYIKGGKPEGATREYPGCSDRKAPELDRRFEMPHELFFSGSSAVWGGGGVAFVTLEEVPGVKTLGRRYLVTVEQFTEIVRQENDSDPRSGRVYFEIDDAIRDHAAPVVGADWYSTILYLGHRDGYPVLTFTTMDEDLVGMVCAPYRDYLATIIRGIEDTHDLGVQGILRYLGGVRGIKGIYSDRTLRERIEQAIE